VPVVYAGPGPARDDIAAHDLGWVADHDPASVAEQMVAALTTPVEDGRAQRVSAWVADNASAAAAGRAAADVVLSAVRR
jgi:thiamine kinase-like enzyme